MAKYSQYHSHHYDILLTRTEVERELHHGAFVHLIDERNVWQAVSVHVRADSVGSVQPSGAGNI